MACARCGMRYSRQVAQGPDVGLFSVRKALEVLRERPRRRTRIRPRRARAMLGDGRNVSRRHLAHVDTGIPIIVGQTHTHEFILDGRHRGTALLEAGRPVWAHVLNEFETGRTFRPKPPPGLELYVPGRK